MKMTAQYTLPRCTKRNKSLHFWCLYYRATCIHDHISRPRVRRQSIIGGTILPWSGPISIEKTFKTARLVSPEYKPFSFCPQQVATNSFYCVFVLLTRIVTETSALLHCKGNVRADHCLEITERSDHWTIFPIADARFVIWIVIQQSSADSRRIMHFCAIWYVIEANHLKNTFNHARLRQLNWSVR